MADDKLRALGYNILIILLIILIHKIPLFLFFQSMGVSEIRADLFDKICLNTVVIFFGIYEIRKKNFLVESGLLLSMKSPYLYAILLFYLFLFTGGFNSLKAIPGHELFNSLVFIFLIKSITVGILEEVIFRGLIQSSILKVFLEDKNGILKGVLISAILFGLAHVINIGQDYISIGGVMQQIFAATCLGALFGAILIRTKNIYPIVILHAAISFFTLIGTLFPEYFPDKPQIEESNLQIIVGLLLVILLFGSALVTAIYLIRSKKVIH